MVNGKPLNSITTKYGRFYQSPVSGNWYPSVTTVTGYAKKDFFNEWRKNPENQKKSRLSTQRGTKVHSMVESFFVNERTLDLDLFEEVDSESVRMFYQLKPELENIKEISLMEESLWSDSLRMAGRVDCIGTYKDQLSIIDYKTSSRSKKEDWILNYFQQATAYAIMHEEIYKIPINQVVILITCEDGNVQTFIKDKKDYIDSLNTAISQYWKDNSFNKLQKYIKEIPDGDIIRD